MSRATVAAAPGTAAPRTAPPGTAAPGAAAPGTAPPGTAGPGTAARATAAPGAAARGTAAPEAAAPGTVPPGTAGPGTAARATAAPRAAAAESGGGSRRDGLERAREVAAGGAELARVRAVAAEVMDPELPVLTLADLGVLRDVALEDGRRVVVTITPTYSGCPAMAVMRADLRAGLRAAGYADVEVRTVLDPPWTTDWISDRGRRALAAHGVAPPGPVPRRPAGPVPLTLVRPRRTVACPRCGSTDTEETSEFGATACKALRRCRSCAEPFEHVKEI